MTDLFMIMKPGWAVIAFAPVTIRHRVDARSGGNDLWRGLLGGASPVRPRHVGTAAVSLPN
ncbi:hypothetical protein [Kibdelosporangium aridum]|uniref:hypothetical protein n=1 Tax=Kibdelosporangium aridum TaxID=2030 RepID=UPI00190E665F|nr:hypothetical protein [Kibdelosporangium aridum]